MASESADTRAYMDSVSKNIDALEAKVHDMDLKLATILEFMENSAQKLAEDAPRDAASDSGDVHDRATPQAASTPPNVQDAQVPPSSPSSRWRYGCKLATGCAGLPDDGPSSDACCRAGPEPEATNTAGTTRLDVHDDVSHDAANAKATAAP